METMGGQNQEVYAREMGSSTEVFHGVLYFSTNRITITVVILSSDFSDFYSFAPDYSSFPWLGFFKDKGSTMTVQPILVP